MAAKVKKQNKKKKPHTHTNHPPKKQHSVYHENIENIANQ